MNLLKAARDMGMIWASWLGAGGRPVDKEVSQHRANTCLKCPKHEKGSIYEKLTAPVAKVVRAQIELKNRMKLRVDGEKSLGTCTACGCQMCLKVHVPIEFIFQTTDLSELDENCFILSEIRDTQK